MSQMSQIKTQNGTVEQIVANQTLTLVGISKNTTTYSDLGISGQIELYQDRLTTAIARTEARKWSSGIPASLF